MQWPVRGGGGPLGSAHRTSPTLLLFVCVCLGGGGGSQFKKKKKGGEINGANVLHIVLLITHSDPYPFRDPGSPPSCYEL